MQGYLHSASTSPHNPPAALPSACSSIKDIKHPARGIFKLWLYFLVRLLWFSVNPKSSVLLPVWSFFSRVKLILNKFILPQRSRSPFYFYPLYFHVVFSLLRLTNRHLQAVTSDIPCKAGKVQALLCFPVYFFSIPSTIPTFWAHN